jgi:hypothetical protein
VRQSWRAMPNILVGTASWTDRSLIDSRRFYPPEVRTSEDRLRYYSSQFFFVEVDSSPYFLPQDGGNFSTGCGSHREDQEHGVR